MYQLDDQYGNMFITISDDIVRDRNHKVLGSIRHGVVCDKDGTPTRCSIEGNNVMFLAPATNTETVALTVSGTNIMDSGTVGAVVVGATSEKEIMLAAAAYFEFVWSLT